MLVASENTAKATNAAAGNGVSGRPDPGTVPGRSATQEQTPAGQRHAAPAAGATRPLRAGRTTSRLIHTSGTAEAPAAGGSGTSACLNRPSGLAERHPGTPGFGLDARAAARPGLGRQGLQFEDQPRCYAGVASRRLARQGGPGRQSAQEGPQGRPTRPPSTRRSTRSATPSSAASTASSATAQSPPVRQAGRALRSHRHRRGYRRVAPT
jgi:hypothetical protein